MTPFHRLVDQGDLPEPVFAFYLGTDSPGELTIGACRMTNDTHDSCHDASHAYASVGLIP